MHICRLLLIASILAVFAPAKVSAQDRMMVSIINLVATPEKYNDKNIMVQGYFVIEQDNIALYLNKEDADNNLFRNGIWLRFTNKEEREKYSEKQNTYVFVHGAFHSQPESEHLFRGYIDNITRIFRTPPK